MTGSSYARVRFSRSLFFQYRWATRNHPTDGAKSMWIQYLQKKKHFSRCWSLQVLYFFKYCIFLSTVSF